MRSNVEFFGFNSYLNFWTGVVEDIADPLGVGRVRVRIHGLHDEDRNKLPTKDLLWADIMQPVTSAANSGVGHSPTGLLPATWVCGIFLDGANCQRPLIMGTLPGLHKHNSIRPGNQQGRAQQPPRRPPNAGQQSPTSPPSPGPATQGGGAGGAGAPTSSGGGGGGGGQVSGGRYRDVYVNDNNFRTGGTRPGPITGIVIHNTAGTTLAGAVSTNYARGTGYHVYVTPDGTRYHYAPDNARMYHIGQPANGLNNNNSLGISAVARNESAVTQAQRESIREYAGAKAAEHGFGTEGISAHGFSSNRGNDEGMASYRDIQQQGLPTQTNPYDPSLPPLSYPTEPPVFDQTPGQGEVPAPQVPADYNPNAPLDFDEPPPAAGGDPQTPADFDPNQPLDFDEPPSGFETTNPNDIGFDDPLAMYPRDFSKDHSTHPFARGSNTDPNYNSGAVETNDALREEQRKTGIEMAGGATFEEPTSPNVAQYPKNNVFATPGGLIMEYDSTQNAERWHVYHPSGSYIEIDARGNLTTKAHGDRVEIDMGNRYIGAKGDFSISSEGALKILSGGEAFMEIRGSLNGSVNHDVRLDIRGNTTINTTNAMRLSAKHMTIEATGGPINMKAESEINLEAATDMNIQSGADMSLESALNINQKAGGDWAMQATGKAMSESGGDMSMKSGGALKMQSEGDASIKSGGDIKTESGTFHAKSNLRVQDELSSPTPAKVVATGAGPGADGAPGADKASDTMKARAEHNKSVSRDGGTGGGGVAGNSMTDTKQEIKEPTKSYDRPVVPVKPRPAASDQKIIQNQNRAKQSQMVAPDGSTTQSAPVPMQQRGMTFGAGAAPPGVNSPAYDAKDIFNRMRTNGISR